MMQHDPGRDRRLLIHRRQIAELAQHVRQKGNTIVPLAVYFHRGWAKVEVGLAVGKRKFDKNAQTSRNANSNATSAGRWASGIGARQRKLAANYANLGI